jgi:alkanesulfonate monooxygenase SsuD/methylene tetrahydromethanopterin reductase-like flavin-dependent oxidoreductase (luciferase family)
MEMAEGLGFDSVWALDHHKTPARANQMFNHFITEMR